MKIKLTAIFILIATLSSLAQQGINYKALIKDSGGNAVMNQTITVQFSILQGTTNVYSETHAPTTDANGIIIINIGNGTVQSGDFTAINWASDDHFLNVQIDTGNGLIDMGTTQFMAVPYALNAANVPTKIDDLEDVKHNGSSLFIGEQAGENDDGNDNKNMGIGYNTLFSNTTGNSNTASGNEALRSNTRGDNNTANGSFALYLNTTGNFNTANGSEALRSNTTGSFNTANSYQALNSNITGASNTANGVFALSKNTTGSFNSANGSWTLNSNTTGSNNTANGFRALNSNTTGDNNTANGHSALYFNTTGYWNTANGYKALHDNTTGYSNTANGYKALHDNTIGYSNTANGVFALNNNTTGDFNTANGHHALISNTTGNRNTATGSNALYSNTTGSFNVAIGNSALHNNISGVQNIAIGNQALFHVVSGFQNIAIGNQALHNVITSSNNIGIGLNAQIPNTNSSNQVRIGNTAIAYAGIQVAWTVTSDKRWKDNIRQLPYGLNMVTRLKPVDYTRKNIETNTREIGFIAQDVEKILSDLGYKDQGFLTKDDEGYISLRYNDLIPVLTKAIQEQQQIIESQNEKITAQINQNLTQNSKINTQNNIMGLLIKRIERLESSNQLKLTHESNVLKSLSFKEND